ncbi:MAG: DNA-methyltransferase [Planctomycetota bacterium]|jgi:site-specific DNA-methyltransferase (adenine-specific)
MKPAAFGPGWEVYQGDALAFLLEYDGEPFDALVTDPPYSSGGATRGDRTSTTLSKYVQNDSSAQQTLSDFEGDNRDQRSFLTWCSLWLMAAWQRCRPGATLHVFSDWRQLPSMSDAIQCGGWIWRGIVPWNKSEGTRPQLGRHRAQCEYTLFGTKGPHVPYIGAPALPGFYECVISRERTHIAEKPVKLIREMLKAVPPGGLVLDLFAGSGAHLEACLLEGRRVVGVELVPSIANLAADRCRATCAGLTIQDLRRGQTPLFGQADNE